MSKEQLKIETGNATIAVYLGYQLFKNSKSKMYNERGDYETKADMWILNPTEQMISTGYHYNDADVEFHDVKFCDAYHHSLNYHESYNSLLPVVNKVMDELEPIQGAKGWDLQCDIRRLLSTCYKSITPLYDKTVEAIQYINQIAAINQ